MDSGEEVGGWVVHISVANQKSLLGTIDSSLQSRPDPATWMKSRPTLRIPGARPAPATRDGRPTAKTRDTERSARQRAAVADSGVKVVIKKQATNAEQNDGAPERQ